MPSKPYLLILFLKSSFNTFCNGNKVKIKITKPCMLINSPAVKRISCFLEVSVSVPSMPTVAHKHLDLQFKTI